MVWALRRARPTRIVYPALIIAGLAARLLYLFHTKSLWADCAVLGLMAKHIGIAGIPDLPLAGPLFRRALGLCDRRLVQALRDIGLHLRAHGPARLQPPGMALLPGGPEAVPGLHPVFATALALIPPYAVLNLMFLYQYGDTLVFICLALLLLMRLTEPDQLGNRLLWAELGLVSGIGLWLSPHFLPIIGAEAVVLWRLGGGPRSMGRTPPGWPDSWSGISRPSFMTSSIRAPRPRAWPGDFSMWIAPTWLRPI